MHTPVCQHLAKFKATGTSNTVQAQLRFWKLTRLPHLCCSHLFFCENKICPHILQLRPQPCHVLSISHNICSSHPHCFGNLNHCLPHRTVCTVLDNPVSRSQIDKVQ